MCNEKEGGTFTVIARVSHALHKQRLTLVNPDLCVILPTSRNSYVFGCFKMSCVSEEQLNGCFCGCHNVSSGYLWSTDILKLGHILHVPIHTPFILDMNINFLTSLFPVLCKLCKVSFRKMSKKQLKIRGRFSLAFRGERRTVITWQLPF